MSDKPQDGWYWHTDEKNGRYPIKKGWTHKSALDRWYLIKEASRHERKWAKFASYADLAKSQQNYYLTMAAQLERHLDGLSL